MDLTKAFKLEKLKIDAFGNRRRAGLPQKTITVMFNPESFSMRHENKLKHIPGINTSGRQATYSHSLSDELALDLVFDGTGVSDMGWRAPVGKGMRSVAEQIDDFLEACFYLDGKIHEPKHLTIHWGDGPLRSFECRLKSADITYSLFDKSGAALRATLKAVFMEGIDTAMRVRKEGKSSPDLSHHRVVRIGESLPLLCQEIYGTSAHYLEVAAANGLDDFRNLVPGQELVFPPLTVAAGPAAPYARV
ncbi:MAG TPA: LysM peptidoglycan-binding domain-containing protein [Verrucomicrobiota bacterium]|nr:hypothetical protein [Verrucomicrobiales bacterium]HRI15308.1 LysM peptidoglycan-binding domain-containing protein [Verrucomicrobiota bacterium]